MKFFTPRRLIIIGLLMIMPMYLTTIHSIRIRSEAPWPMQTVAGAQEVSLSEAWRQLNEPLEGREAAILDEHILIKTTIHADAEEVAAGLQPPKIMVVKALLPFPAHDLITEITRDAAVDVQIYRNPEMNSSWTDRLIQLLPALFLIVLLGVFLTRGASRSLGLNAAFEIVEQDKLKETFDDVAGIDGARAEIEEIVSFLKDPAEATRLGARMPKGALFDGPPGAGKTLLARAMAKEAGVPFIMIEASGVNQLFVGAGAMKIRKAFREARKRAPCIVFVDEIDAMGKARGTGGPGGAGDEKETTLNALLVELDGFDAREGVFLIAATNRPEVLDPALTRRGRIDRRITVSLPDLEGRKDILEVHLRKVKAITGIDISRIAASTFGFSGADLAALVNEAALRAAVSKRDYVEMQDFEYARDRLLVGLSGAQRKLNSADRRLTAIHEAGHALIATRTPGADPVEKATIVPQGPALGYVMQTPDQDRVFESRERLVSRIRVAVAGREAEQLVFGPDAITSGASSDIRAATRIARAMVAEFGMSSQGFVQIDPHDPLLIDPQKAPLRNIAALIEEAQSWVRDRLEAEQAGLLALADALEARETLSGSDIRDILDGPAAVAA